MKRLLILLREPFIKGLLVIMFILFLYFMALMASFLYVLTNY